MVGTVTGDEHPLPRVNGMADRFRRVRVRIVPAGGPAVRGLGSPLTGSGVPAAELLTIHSQTGEARPVAGVIRSRLVLSPSGSGFSPPYDISHRGVKFPGFLALLGALSGGSGPIYREWAPAIAWRGQPSDYQKARSMRIVLAFGGTRGS